MAELVKTVLGLARASVKSIDGLAIASAKTIMGLDNTAAGGAIAFIGSGSSTNGTNDCAATLATAAGGNFIAVMVADYGAVTIGTVTDDEGNAYRYGTTYTDGSFVRGRFAYCENATCSDGMVVTYTAVGSFPIIAVLVFSGVHSASDPIDQQNGLTPAGSRTSMQPGSVTPGSNDQVVIAGSTMYQVYTTSIDSPFSTPVQGSSSGAQFGVSISYEIQATATARNPTFSWSTNSTAGAAIATFNKA